MPSQTFIASKAPSELCYHSQKSMLLVALLAPVMRAPDFCDQLMAKPYP